MKPNLFMFRLLGKTIRTNSGTYKIIQECFQMLFNACYNADNVSIKCYEH